MPNVSITRARFPRNRAGDVEAQFRNEVAPTFQQLKQQGQVDRAFFVIDRDGGEAIGIAFYSSDQDLSNVEGQRGRQAGPSIEDPGRAPTDVAKRRAKSVRDSGAAMDKSEWYDLVSEV